MTWHSHRVIIFGFLPKSPEMLAVAVAFSMAWLGAGVEPRPEDDRARERLAAFRGELYRCFTARADALFELADGAPRGAGVRMEVRDRPSPCCRSSGVKLEAA
jgi:hypothetical protein